VGASLIPPNPLKGAFGKFLKLDSFLRNVNPLARGFIFPEKGIGAIKLWHTAKK
jgi:hypothetical protein